MAAGRAVSRLPRQNAGLDGGKPGIRPDAAPVSRRLSLHSSWHSAISLPWRYRGRHLALRAVEVCCDHAW